GRGGGGAAVAGRWGWRHGRGVGRETTRRGLRREQIVWRRPRPVLGRRDPRREAILAELRGLLLGLPDDETVVFEDEVDVNLNPKVGCMWMRRGAQGPGPPPPPHAQHQPPRLPPPPPRTP